MGILRTTEWRSTRAPHETDAALRAAMAKLSMEVSGPVGAIEAASKRSLMKNRWAAKISAQLTPRGDGAAVRWRVDALGDKHFDILDDIAAELPAGLLDDQGIAAAVADLGLHRVFGRKEIRHLHNVLHVDEDVVALGTGQYGSKLGLVALTNDRLFFFEKSLLSLESLDEFPLASIASLTVQKSRTGETLTVHSSGNTVEIKNMGHGQADAVVRGLRDVRAAAAAPAPASAPAPAPADDPVARIERLAGLRDKGLISDADYEQKKAELLGRL
ncbi:PH domain-containing protein [Spirilliplanes yamanashiensis]|uniref:Uncharacterized protein n=1 Tax=Spirilliplanes yamanashiensis TaxID=42233 RepID=A0A8J4DI07_9ACTN|nr:PH domain-containing protein [Spirilliplanes yamanashiensis]MDP9814651.1 hypothetical protein [Spirilliplanes yamanashiensis]GIJ02306.1 hypothetical protein Sya03_16580 [Spirilliplanes yamanashiensis]